MKIKRTASFLAAGALAAALVPAAASADPPGPVGPMSDPVKASTADEVEVTSSKIKLGALETTGWAFYCPSSHPKLKQIPDSNQSVWRDLSDSSVSALPNWWRTDIDGGKFVVTFTNWSLSGADAQVAYTCVK